MSYLIGILFFTFIIIGYYFGFKLNEQIIKIEKEYNLHFKTQKFSNYLIDLKEVKKLIINTDDLELIEKLKIVVELRKKEKFFFVISFLIVLLRIILGTIINILFC